MLHIAHEEGLLSNDSNMHLGSRSMLFDKHYDMENDARCGFTVIRARMIDDIGVDEIVRRVVETVGDNYVYVSIDIDVLDPGAHHIIIKSSFADHREQPSHPLLEPLNPVDGRQESFFAFCMVCHRQACQLLALMLSSSPLYTTTRQKRRGSQ